MTPQEIIKILLTYVDICDIQLFRFTVFEIRKTQKKLMASNRQAILLCGHGYGDECKGSVTDYLARVHNAHTVIRYNGASQAAHNVTLSDGRHHTFSQFGSASFIPGVRTHLSQFMLVNPINLLREADKLSQQGITDVCDRTTVDERSLIITPFHCSANRLRELSRGAYRHGSCGQGVGETVRDAAIQDENIIIRAADLCDLRKVALKLKAIQDFKISQIADIINLGAEDECLKRELSVLHSTDLVSKILSWYEEFAQSISIVDNCHIRNILDRCGTTIFEGAQGTLLDETYGFHPHVTSTNITYANAESIIRECEYDDEILHYGLVRAYLTRHGPGPFVTEDDNLSHLLPDVHNVMHEWQRGFRVGWFDLVATQYALSVVKNTEGLIVSCLDRFDSLPEWKVCVGYYHPQLGYLERIEPCKGDSQEPLTKVLNECQPVYHTFKGKDTEAYLRLLEERLGVPIVLTSYGPTEKDKHLFKLQDSFCSLHV